MASEADTSSERIYFDWPALCTSLEKYTKAREDLDYLVDFRNRARKWEEKPMHEEYLGTKVEDGLTELGNVRVALRTAMSGYSRAGGTFEYLMEKMECPEVSRKDLERQWEQRGNLRSESPIKWADIED